MGCLRLSSALSSFITAGIPPAWSRSSIAYAPLGIMLQRCGTFRPITSKVESGKVTPASWAMAGKCRVVLVEPPNAMSTAMAFSNASLVRICEGLRSSLTSLTTCLPVALARRILKALVANEVAQ